MRQANIFVHGKLAGCLIEQEAGGYVIEYLTGYQGPPISLTLPIAHQSYQFKEFPPFFEGLLPEGPQLDALLRQAKLDKKDYFGQLLTVGEDLVGAVTISKATVE